MDDAVELSNHLDDENFERNTFDFECLYNAMKKCTTENISDPEDIELNNYLIAYSQLHNFFLLLGTAFQFLALDVENKIKILKSYQSKEEKQLNSPKNFITVKTMVNYEESNKLLTDSSYVSGCRTLLRLHRGLDFVRKFLRYIYYSADEEKLSRAAKEVYDETLAKYHTWVVRKAAKLAMSFLPTRGELIKQITKNNDCIYHRTMELFPDAIEIMNIVYDRIQNIYAVNELLNLP